MDKENSYLERYKEFYSLKNKYDSYIRNKKQAIINSTLLSKKDKKYKFKHMKKKCVNCNKEGGTIFTIGDSLIAKCGNKEQPCDLNITFEKKETITSKELSDLLHNEITNIRRVIVNTKMDYLFQYKTEEEIVTWVTRIIEELPDSANMY